MTENNPSELGKALAGFQRELPAVRKGATGQVAGNRNYKYADLADVHAAVLPVLAKHGLSWLTMPTFTEDGRFVLRYELLHESGESRTGFYPLPQDGTPQQIGSALTYGRRYTLSSVVGVAPDEDDDGHAATQHYQQRQQVRQAERRPSAQPAPVAAVSEPADPAGQARADLAKLADELGMDRQVVANRYKATTGADLRAETDAGRIAEFAASLASQPQQEAS